MENSCFTSATSHLEFANERGVMSSEYDGPSKTYWPAQAWMYHRCMELAIVLGKDSRNSDFNYASGLKTPTWCSSINIPCFSKKVACVLSRQGVGTTVKLASKIRWWHGNTDYDSTSLKLYFILLSTARDQICWYHVMHGINQYSAHIVGVKLPWNVVSLWECDTNSTRAITNSTPPLFNKATGAFSYYSDLTLSQAFQLMAPGSAAFKESCAPIG